MIYEKFHLTLIELQGPCTPGQCCILKAEHKKVPWNMLCSATRGERERKRGISSLLLDLNSKIVKMTEIKCIEQSQVGQSSKQGNLNEVLSSLFLGSSGFLHMPWKGIKRDVKAVNRAEQTLWLQGAGKPQSRECRGAPSFSSLNEPHQKPLQIKREGNNITVLSSEENFS